MSPYHFSICCHWNAHLRLECTSRSPPSFVLCAASSRAPGCFAAAQFVRPHRYSVSPLLLLVCFVAGVHTCVRATCASVRWSRCHLYGSRFRRLLFFFASSGPALKYSLGSPSSLSMVGYLVVVSFALAALCASSVRRNNQKDSACIWPVI